MALIDQVVRQESEAVLRTVIRGPATLAGPLGGVSHVPLNLSLRAFQQLLPLLPKTLELWRLWRQFATAPEDKNVLATRINTTGSSRCTC
jgi:hypothetical protein